MRVLFLPTGWTLLSSFVVWAVINLSVSFLIVYLPDKFLNPKSLLFRTHEFEKGGQLYEKVFHVRRWKHLLPDGGSLWKKRGYKKRHLESYSETNLQRFLVESCRAELTHWLVILPFWVFGFFLPVASMWFMLLYALLANLPCIIAQRFNRPRVEKLLSRMKDKQVIGNRNDPSNV